MLPFIGCIIAMLVLVILGGFLGAAAAASSAWALLLFWAAEVSLTYVIGRSLGDFDKIGLLGIILFLLTVSMLCVFGIVRLGGF